MTEKHEKVPKTSKIPKGSEASKEMKELTAKCEDYLVGWKRALADYDNLRRDLAKERDESRRYAMERAVEGFLGVLEHFDQAMRHEPDLSSCDEAVVKQLTSWLAGITYIRTAMVEELKGLGLESIEPEIGTLYDPQTQESVGSKEHEGDAETILEVVSRGWKMGEKILRPPRVIISS